MNPTNHTRRAPVVQIEKLWSVFRSAGQQAVIHKDLDLVIEAGELLSIVGGSGSGKTVLLRQILGLETPAQGSVTVLGKPAASKDAIGKPKGTQLKISVTAAPKGGKATDYMVRFLAPLFGVTVADIEVVFGQENVNKQLRIKAPKKLPAVFNQASLDLE